MKKCCPVLPAKLNFCLYKKEKMFQFVPNLLEKNRYLGMIIAISQNDRLVNFKL